MEVKLDFEGNAPLQVDVTGGALARLHIPNSRLVGVSCFVSNLYFINWWHELAVVVNLDAGLVMKRAAKNNSGVAGEVLAEIENYRSISNLIFVINTNGCDPLGRTILIDRWPSTCCGILCDLPIDRANDFRIGFDS